MGLKAQRCTSKLISNSTRSQRRLKALPKSVELTRRIGRPPRGTRVDRPALKLIADVSWKKVHMQMRGCVAMNLIVHLDRLYDRGDGRRNSSHVPHECGPLRLAQIMELNGVPGKHQTRVPAHRIIRSHQNPGSLELGEGPSFAPAHRAVSARTLSLPFAEIRPGAHKGSEG